MSLTHPEINHQSATGFFCHLSDLENAITSLRSVGFPLSRITLVASHFRRQDQFTDAKLCDRLEAARLEIDRLEIDRLEIDRLEIDTEQAHRYQARLEQGEYMVIMYGTEDDLNCAASILNPHRIQDWQMHSPMSLLR